MSYLFKEKENYRFNLENREESILFVHLNKKEK
jgi:hypothetical protein